MNRRDFLKAFAAGGAMIMLPELAVAQTPKVYEFPMNTVQDLTAWMENRYECFNGEPKAYMDLTEPQLFGFGLSPKDVAPENFVYEDEKPTHVRIMYSIVAFGLMCDDPVEAERRLVQHVQQSLMESAPPQKLIWRVKPMFDSGEHTIFGDTYMTWEQVHDRDGNEALQKLYDEKPEDVAYDFDTDSLRYVKQRGTLNKIRMRLAFPTMPDDDYESFAHAEGARLKRIS